MNNPHKNYKEYWAEISPLLEKHVDKSLLTDALTYIDSSLAFYCYTTEDLNEKITLNKEVAKALIVPIVETQDILRGILALYKNLNLAPLAIMLRTSFEIYCTLKFIATRDNPALYADRFFRYQEIEQIKHLRAVPGFPNKLSQSIPEILDRNPEWKDPATGNLVKRAHWSATFSSFEEIARECGEQANYDSVYRTNSKFTHASPLLKNMYHGADGLGAIPKPSLALSMALQATHYCIATLKVFCEMYGVLFDEDEYNYILQFMMNCNPQLKQMQENEMDDYLAKVRKNQKEPNT